MANMLMDKPTGERCEKQMIQYNGIKHVCGMQQFVTGLYLSKEQKLVFIKSLFLLLHLHSSSLPLILACMCAVNVCAALTHRPLKTSGF